MVSRNVDQANFKVEDNVETDIVSYEECNGALLEASLIPKVNYDENCTAANIKTDPEHQEYLGSNLKIEDKMNFKLEMEEKVKIEIDSCPEDSQEQYVEPEENIENTTFNGLEQTEEEFDEMMTWNGTENRIGLKWNEYMKETERKYRRLTGDQKLMCTVCHLEFHGESELKIHMETKHNNIKKYKCDDFSTHTVNNIKTSTNLKKLPQSYLGTDLEIKKEVECKLEMAENIKLKFESYQEEAEKVSQQFLEQENIETARILGSKRIKEEFEMSAWVDTKNKVGPNDNRKNETKWKSSRLIVDQTELYAFSEKFMCTVCDCEFYDKSELENHIQMYHNNIKINKCDNFLTHTEKNHKIHITYIHSKERKYECHFCDYKANKKSHLDMHISSVHLNERKFECNLCEYKANQKSKLNSHISSVHLNNRKFECHLCEYKANKKSHLETHISSIHLKERKFECHLCHYKANQKSRLDMHTSSVHLRERKFGCPL